MDVPGETDEAMPYLYTSQEWDNETKLYNYKARFYDPQMGRFFSTDAAGEFASPYIYCGNNPIMFTDPSGNMSGGAIFGIAVGVTAIAVGIGVTVATAGAGASVAIGGALAAGALIGGGSSSVGYSAGAGDDWNPAAWAGSTIVGAGLGAASAGIGMKAGAAVSAATNTTQTLAKSSALSIGAGVAVGALTDTTIGVLGTVAYNVVSGENLSAGLGGAVIGGLIGGGGGGAAGGLAGLFKGLRGNAFVNAASKQNFRNMPFFDPAADRQMRANPLVARRHEGGGTGIIHVGSKEIDIGYHLADAQQEGFGAPHAVQARVRYGVNPNGGEFVDIRDTPEGLRATYPNLRGFTVNKIGANKARVGFTSQTLNGFTGFDAEGNHRPDARAWLNSPTLRMQILTGLRAEGVRVSLAPRIDGPLFAHYTNAEKFLTFFL